MYLNNKYILKKNIYFVIIFILLIINESNIINNNIKLTIIIIFSILNIIINKYIKNIYLSSLILFIIIWIILLNINPFNINENKYTLLQYIPEEFSLKTHMLKDINIHILKYPVIFKPIICSKCSRGVILINNIEEANKYIQNKNITNIMVQDYTNYNNEIGILYEKDIINNTGKIISMVRNETDFINKKILSKINLTHLITPELNNQIDIISNNIPNFFAGRYDIKYKNLESLLKGKDFYILEVNGSYGYDLRKENILFIYSFRWNIYRLLRGCKNIITSKGYNINTQLSIIKKVIYNTLKCRDLGNLFYLYS
jgi:hypothetical protein